MMKYKHLKSGKIYKVLFTVIIESDLVPGVVYQSLSTGNVFVRPASEFYDGRFVLEVE